MIKLKLPLFFVLFVASSALVRAQANRVLTQPAPPPTVVCSFANGDRVRGAAQALDAEVITLGTEYAGPVRLRLAAIASCETSDAEMQTRVNELIYVAQQPTPELLASAAALPAQLIEVAPPPPVPGATSQPPDAPRGGVWKKSLAFSYNFARGNADINDMNIAGGVEYKETDGRLVIQSLVRRGTKDGKDLAGLFTSTARYERNIGLPFLTPDKVSLFNEVNFERDAMKRLDHRVVWNGGMQLPLMKKDAGEMALDLGGGLTREVYESDSRRTLGSGLIRLKSEQKILGKTKLTQQFAAFPDFAEIGRYRLHADVSVTAPLTKIFSIRIGALNRFDNRPQEAVKRNDFSLSSGLAVNF